MSNVVPLPFVTALRRPVTREMVHKFEQAILKQPQLQLKVIHHFGPGVYMRELHIPADVITTGRIHKYPCLNILAKGKRATLVGDFMEMIVAPHIHLSPAGSKRVSYTLEDSVWITVHATDKTNVEEIEKDLVCDTEEEYQAFLASQSQRCPS